MNSQKQINLKINETYLENYILMNLLKYNYIYQYYRDRTNVFYSWTKSHYYEDIIHKDGSELIQFIVRLMSAYSYNFKMVENGHIVNYPKISYKNFHGNKLHRVLIQLTPRSDPIITGTNHIFLKSAKGIFTCQELCSKNDSEYVLKKRLKICEFEKALRFLKDPKDKQINQINKIIKSCK